MWVNQWKVLLKIGFQKRSFMQEEPVLLEMRVKTISKSTYKSALSLIRAWGFEFKSSFVWVKKQLGIGNYWRGSHELLLLGVKGNLTFPSNNIKSWLEAPRTRHSEKPEGVKDLIEQVSPAPRIELFARIKSKGWTVWGNQIDETSLDRVLNV